MRRLGSFKRDIQKATPLMSTDYLKPLIGPIKQKKFAVLDLESKDGESTITPGFTRVFLGGFYDGDSYECFRGADCLTGLMCGVLVNKYIGWHIYAHNGGRFDFLHLISWLATTGRRLGFTFQIIPSGRSGGIQILDVWREGQKKGRWRFLDSVKLIPLGLEKACKAFNLPGKKTLPLETEESDTQWEIYNEQDCVALWSVLSRFHIYVEQRLGGEVGITTPSTAMKTFRRKYLKEKINRGLSAHDFVMSSYCGGRSEPFKRKGERLHYYDFNSSYPSVMRENMPVGEPIHWEGEPCARLLSGEFIGFVSADVELSMHIPPLPLKKEGKLLFPAGRVTGVWDWAELSLVADSIKRWGRSVWFRGEPILREMVNALYPMRDSSLPGYDPGLSLIVKLLLNALYGKFGQSPERRKVVPWSKDLPKGAIPADGTPDSAVWYIDEKIEAPYIMPQIAAHVTSLARVKLFLKLDEDTCYCDTDSVLTPSFIESSTALGDMKDEYPGVTFEGSFLAPKLYCLNGSDGSVKVVAKGIRNRSYEVFQALCNGETVSSMEIEKLGKMAKKGFAAPEMFELKKSIKGGGIQKRIWKGNDSFPIELEMW